MEKYEMLHLRNDDEMIVSTYNIESIEKLMTQMPMSHPEEMLMIKNNRPWTIRLQIKGQKTKMKSKPDLQLVAHMLGQDGWEPFAATDDAKSLYFRKRMA